MSELISGIDVPKLIKQEVAIQYRTAANGGFKEGQWSDFDLEKLEDEFTLGDLINAGRWDFRLKPKTITINGVEVPAPFEPKIGETYYHLSSVFDKGYHWNDEFISIEDDFKYMQFGAWRTEEEIKQVVAALRSIFKG